MSPDPPAAPPLEDAVERLQRFWSQRGCRLLPGCDFALSEAILHPDCYFNLLGAEPWRAVFLQSLRRPLDARGGDHPYRRIRPLRLQVVLQPPPADVEALFRESLGAVGLELEHHDLRFVDRTWELVPLGARGRGRRAVLDGLGVSRLSYVERVADRDLEPPGCAISYDLERLLPRQQSDGACERELSRYVLEIAAAGDLRRRLEALDGDAGRCLGAALARPAYELAVRCLEPLDLLDARGDLTARERAAWLDKIRRRVAAAAGLHLTADAVPEEAALKKKTQGKKTAGKADGEAPKARRRGRAKRARKAPKRPPPVAVVDPAVEDAWERLDEPGVDPLTAQRRGALRADLERHAAELGGALAGAGELLAAHVDGCEAPGVVRGAFDPGYLTLPEEVVLAALRRQGAFGVRGEDGLLPRFLAVMDRADDSRGYVRAGQERAVAGRLVDARFRYDADCRLTLAELRRRLEETDFHPRLGSWAAKGERVRALVELAGRELGWEGALAAAGEAAGLLEADLTTGLVRDFPSLHGVLGGLYAREEGYAEEVWRAIYEHDRGRRIPSQRPGRLLAVADRLDSLVGLFGIGEAPNGGRDPLALRPLAGGLLRILIEGEMELDLDLMAARAVLLYGEMLEGGAEELLRELQVFLAERCRSLLGRKGFAEDEIAAAAAVGWRSLPDLMSRLEALRTVREEAGFRSLVLASQRIFSIVKDSPDVELEGDELAGGAEIELREALTSVRARVDAAIGERRYEDGLRAMAQLVPPLERFFADVLVMDEDESLRHNRVALLQACRRVFWRVARLQDMTVEKSGSAEIDGHEVV